MTIKHKPTCRYLHCDKDSWAVGFCKRHYQYYRRHNGSFKGIETRGYSNLPEYVIWKSMRLRCNNPKTNGYKNYGGRNIKVCDRWNNNFLNFLEDMGKRPFPKAQIDRINNNGNYCKENCEWTTHLINNRHKSSTKLSEGKAELIREMVKNGYKQKQLGEIFSVNPSTISYIIGNKRWCEGGIIFC